ncbi:MAG: hypothetical protein K2L13_00245, partial [Opitutales bacterium]|nr:hypothetical protein [Opitutales bacterium]
MSEINSNEIFRVAHDNEESNKFSLQDAKGARQSENILDLSNTSRLGRWISEYGVNAANRTACEIGK